MLNILWMAILVTAGVYIGYKRFKNKRKGMMILGVAGAILSFIPFILIITILVVTIFIVLLLATLNDHLVKKE